MSININNNVKEIKEPIFDDLNTFDIMVGRQIPPHTRLATFTPDDYEQFTQTWLYATKLNDYEKIGRYGGAGDKGRDVVGICIDGLWDNYQCKRYASALNPSTLYKEIGKIIYYTYNGDYYSPRIYCFVSPKGISNTCRDLLHTPTDLREKIIEVWDDSCSDNITSTKKISIDKPLKEYIENFDFSIFTYIDSDQMIEELRNTKYFKFFFGGGFEKPRKRTIDVPQEISVNESRYITCLLEAYNDYHNDNISEINELIKYSNEHSHFIRQRMNYYSTEALKKYAHDTLPSDNDFIELKEEYFDALIDIVNDNFSNGYECLKASLKEVTNVCCHNNILNNVMTVKDKKGMCHHLSNEGLIKWVKYDE